VYWAESETAGEGTSVEIPVQEYNDGWVEDTPNYREVMTFDGTSTDKDRAYSGVTLGGFEISGSSYLIAGYKDIAPRGEGNNEYNYEQGGNIFVLKVDKETGAKSVNYITNYELGSGITSTPQFVSIGNDTYMLLWSRSNTVYYTLIDGNGNQTGEIYSMSGNLSDCVPLVSGGKLIWYVWRYRIVTFYEISLADMTGNAVTLTGTYETIKTLPEKGSILKDGKNTYKVTETGKEVAFVGTTSTSTSLTIGAAVTIDGTSYKITSIAANALKGNKKVKKVTIGSNVKTIGASAFRNCKNLGKVVVKSSKLKKVGKNAFKGTSASIKVLTPSKKLSAYKKLLKNAGLGKKAKIVKNSSKK
jgi:hypothetical protein